MENLNGVINIYKEKDFTSHDVVNIVRGCLNRIKTGHTGTLDPNATGVLPICIGKATKISEYISSSRKKYRGEIILGITTNTLDITGEILTKNNVNVTEEEIKNAVNSFLGEIEQIPPMYSAIKVNGKKLYELARQGKEIERKKRKVTIYSINILEIIENEKIIIDVECSKGTYIRTLCDDIGKKLGCGGAMGELERTLSGNFKVEDSININKFREEINNNNIKKYIIPIEKFFSDYKKIFVSEKAEKFLYNGNKISFDFLSEKNFLDNEEILIFNKENILVGIYIVLLNEKFIKPKVMLY